MPRVTEYFAMSWHG